MHHLPTPPRPAPLPLHMAEPESTTDPVPAPPPTAAVDCPLLRLPPELLVEIVQCLPSRGDAVRTARTCSRLHGITTPFIYAHVRLGHYAASDDELRAAPSSKTGELFATLKVLKALGKPRLARAVGFLDHVDQRAPNITSTTEARFQRREPDDDDDAAQDGRNAAPYRNYPKVFVGELASILHTSLAAVGEHAGLHTLRVVGHSPSLAERLLDLPFRCPSLRRLWLEDTPVECLAHVLGRWAAGAGTTHLTHVRLRKLRPKPFRDGLRWAPAAQHPLFEVVPRYVQLLLARSPLLTSLALDELQNLADLPAMLAPLTFPALVAFQLRSQNADSYTVPFYLSDPPIVAFLRRHPRLRALAWPAEHLVPPDRAAILALQPLLDQWARRLEWLRSDCTTLGVGGVVGIIGRDHDRMRPGGAPRASRCFLSRLIRACARLRTLKLQGDFARDELEDICAAVAASGSSATLTKFSIIQGRLEPVVLRAVVAAMPQLRELKLCAYLKPGLVRLHWLDTDEEDSSGMTFVRTTIFWSACLPN